MSTPTVTSITSDFSNSTVTAIGTDIDISVVFSESVNHNGSSTLTLHTDDLPEPSEEELKNMPELEIAPKLRNIQSSLSTPLKGPIAYLRVQVTKANIK